MPKSNMDVDFYDENITDDKTKSDNEYKNKRAKLAHQLAVVLLFDQKAKHLEEQKKQSKPIKRVVSAKKGALEGVK
ncbi:hypothetical protein ACED16_02620 [Enterobacter hormaechei]